MSPPELRFISDFWHPNVYKDTGIVCISILHPPGEDEMSGELPEERWLPTQTVTTILLSVISLLNAPNFSSPANVDASVEWRNSYDLYKKKIQRLIEKANKEKPNNVVIPHPDTNQEEREKQVEKMKEMNKPMEMDDFLQEDNVGVDTSTEENNSAGSGENSEDANESEEDKEKTKSKKSSKSHKGKQKVDAKKKGKSSKNHLKDKDKSKSTSKVSKEEMEDTDPPELVSSNSSDKRRKKKKCTIM